MPPSSACVLVWPLLPAPPAALRSIHALLQAAPTELSAAAVAASALTTTRGAATSAGANHVPGAATTHALLPAPAVSSAATAAATAAASAVAGESSSAIATPALAASHSNGRASLAPSSLHAWLHESDSCDGSLLLDLVEWLARPFPVSCSSCSARVQSRRAPAPVAPAPAVDRDSPLADTDGPPALQEDEGATPAAADHAAYFAGIHSRTRLSIESPAFQLNFLRFVPTMLAHERRRANDGATAAPGSEAASLQSPSCRTPLVALLRQYALECDWRVDEEEFLRRCQLMPPALAPIPVVGATAAAFASSDPLFPPTGLYIPAPPQQVASRSYYHHSAIFDALRALVVQVMPDDLPPLTLPSKQERYFKNQQLAVTTNSDLYADVVARLKQHSLQATFASPSASGPSRMQAPNSSEPLRPFQAAHFPKSPWLRFQASEEEKAVQRAETLLKEERHARRKRRREKREQEQEQDALFGKRSRDGDGGVDALAGTSIDEAQDSVQLVEPSRASESKNAFDSDEDLIMLSQAPRNTSVVVAATGASLVGADKCPARFRRGSLDSLSSSSSSGTSTPSRRPSDPLDVAAAQLGLLHSPFPDLLFDEPDEGEQWQQDGMDEGAAFSFTQSQSQGHAHTGMSLDEAFASASQQQRAREMETADDRAGEAVGDAAPMEIEPPANVEATLPPSAPSDVSPPSAVARASPSPPPPPEPLLPQLAALRSTLESKLSTASVQSSVLQVLRDHDASAAAAAAASSSSAPAKGVQLQTLLAHPQLSKHSSALAQLFSVARQWRDDVQSAADFDAACAHFRLDTLAPAPLLLFFVAFLGPDLSHARARVVLRQSLLPLLRAQCEQKTPVGEALQALLALLLRGFEEALVDSVLCPLLAHVFGAHGPGDGGRSTPVAANAPTVALLQQLTAEPDAPTGGTAPADAAARPAAAVLSAPSRLLMLQQLCVVSLQEYERAHAASGCGAAFVWSDAALLLLSRLLSSRLTVLPPPHAEHHAALGALAASLGTVGGGVGVLAKLLPWAAAAASAASGLSALSASAGAGAERPLGDVSSLLLACFALGAANPQTRGRASFARVLMSYATAHAAAHGLAREPHLRQLMQTIAARVAPMPAKTIAKALAAAASQTAKA